MCNWCCWYWCQQPRPLTATELLVAASFNTAVRRISRVNSDDSLENVSLRYNTFIVPPSSGPCSVPLCPVLYEAGPKAEEHNNTAEMLALVRPLQLHQEQRKLHARHNGLDSMGHKEHDHRNSSDECDSQSPLCRSDEEQEDGYSMLGTENYLGPLDDVDFEASQSPEGRTPDYPMDECFGSVIVSTRKISEKMY